VTVASEDEGFGPWAPGIDEIERRVQLGMLAALVLFIVGPDAPLTKALTEAAWGRPGAAAEARRKLDAMPALPKRRLLATFICLIPGGNIERRPMKKAKKPSKGRVSLSYVGLLGAAVGSGVTPELICSPRECCARLRQIPAPADQITRDQVAARSRDQVST
jgi:hypothetical protein